MFSAKTYTIQNTIYLDIHNKEEGGGAIFYSIDGPKNTVFMLRFVQFIYVTSDSAKHSTGGAIMASLSTGGVISMESVCGYMCKAATKGMFAYLGTSEHGNGVAYQLSVTCCGWKDKAKSHSAIEIPAGVRMMFSNTNISSCQNGPATDTSSHGGIIRVNFGYEIEFSKSNFINNTGYSLIMIDALDGSKSLFNLVNIYKNTANYAIFEQIYTITEMSNCYIFKNVDVSGNIIMLKQGRANLLITNSFLDADISDVTIDSSVDETAKETLGSFGTVLNLCKPVLPPIKISNSAIFTNSASFMASVTFSSSSKFTSSIQFTKSDFFSQSNQFSKSLPFTPPFPSKSPSPTVSQSSIPTTKFKLIPPLRSKVSIESKHSTQTKELHTNTFTPSRTNDIDLSHLIRANIKNEFGNLSSGQVAAIATSVSLTLILVAVLIMIIYIYFRKQRLKKHKSRTFSISDSLNDPSSSDLSYSYSYESYSYSMQSMTNQSSASSDPFTILSSGT